jgi:hypothetical protein
MYCPHTILVNNKFIFIMLHTSGDFNYIKDIPLKNWFQYWRWDIGFFRKKHGGYKFKIKFRDWSIWD